MTPRVVGPPAAAVVLARGLGTRMQRPDPDAALDPAQHAAAARGLKTLIPDTRGRPFLDHILSSLADAGITRIILVVAPDHSAIADHYLAKPPRRVTIRFAIQAEARGTANALLAAEPLLGDDGFLALNADNLYPVEDLLALRDLGGTGLVAYDRAALLRGSNIPPERIAAFAALRLDQDGYLADVIEKPDSDGFPLVSMNLWRFDAAIFSACRTVPRSVRGEYELPEAVAHFVAGGGRLRVVQSDRGVFDLSRQGDVAGLAAILGRRSIQP